MPPSLKQSVKASNSLAFRKQHDTHRYIAKGQDKVGTKVKFNVRGKMNEAEVVKTPFVPAKYYKKA